MFLIGDVKDRNVVLIDDMIDTAGTLCKLQISLWKKEQNCKSNGYTRCTFRKSIRKHRKISTLEVIVTDTIPVNTELSSKIKVLSCAPLFADVMRSVHEHQSISDKFII
jgi:ribose-phosphate pyrophosphokinase